MKIFVTGGTGFVGGHFINEAVARNHIVTSITRFNSKSKIVLPNSVILRELPLDQLSAIDLVDSDAVIHFASVGVSPQNATWEEMYHFNVLGLLHLLKVSALAGVGKVIVAGSFAEYGASSDDYEFIPPTASLRPITPYASSKAAGFELAHAFCVNNNMPLIYKRIFSAYGQGQFEYNFWPSLRSAAIAGLDFPMTSGKQIRDFIRVEVVAKEFLESVEAALPISKMPVVENVCSGIGTSIYDFAKHWWEVWGAKGTLLPGALESRGTEPRRVVGMR